MDNEEKADDLRAPDADKAGEPAPAEARPEFNGRNLEEALLLAEHRLKLVRTEFNYEVVAEKTKLFGIGKEIVIRAWPKAQVEEGAVRGFLERLLEAFPLDLEFQVKQKNDLVFVVFDGQDKQLLLHKDGTLLLALQHILNKVSGQKVQVDCEFFRKRKEKRLRDYAQDVARQVRESGRNEILDLMNPYERRIVHIAVNQVPGITSESLGDGFLKRVKIFPISRGSKPEPPRTY